jgi:hypothetical protein
VYDSHKCAPHSLNQFSLDSYNGSKGIVDSLLPFSRSEVYGHEILVCLSTLCILLSPTRDVF